MIIRKRIRQLSLVLVVSLLLTTIAPISTSPEAARSVQASQAQPPLPFDPDLILEAMRYEELATGPSVPLRPNTGQVAGLSAPEPPLFDPEQAYVPQLAAPYGIASPHSASPPLCDGEEVELIENGGFEENTSWFSTPERVVYDTSLPHSGDRSIIMIGGSDISLILYQTLDFPAQVNQATISFYLHQDINDPGDKLYLLFYDETFTDFLAGAPIEYTETPGSWQAFSLGFEPDALDALLARKVQVVFFAVADAADHTIYHLDDVSLAACTPLPWCTGVLDNGDLESASLSPWLISGTVTLVADTVHSGYYAARIGGGSSPVQSRSLPLDGASTALRPGPAHAREDIPAGLSPGQGEGLKLPTQRTQAGFQDTPATPPPSDQVFETEQLLRPDAYGWLIETVDTGLGSYGDDTCLVLDGAGYPHIAYSESINNEVKYAYQDAVGWHLETVDSMGYVGWSTSLALDSSGYPHIGYFDNGNDDLKYAYRDASGWYTETVDSPGNVGANASLALDGNSYPHIGYTAYKTNDADLRYAYQDASGWYTETVDSAGYVGTNLSLALDSSGYSHISYHDNANDDLEYAYWNGSAWYTETADSAGDVGWYTSLALDGSGYPHISYYDFGNDDLRYAYQDASGWHTETVDSTGIVGWFTFLALDASGYPHISYFDGGNYDLKYVYKDASGWHTETVDIGLGYYGGFTSLVLDSTGLPHISYYDSTNAALRYAYYAPAQADPDIAVTPASFEQTVVVDELVTKTLIISNTGTALLTFEITEMAAASSPPVVAAASSPAENLEASRKPLAVEREPIADSGAPTGEAVIGAPASPTAPEGIGSAWESRAPLPEPRAFSAVVAEGNYVYVIGGANRISPTTYIYNSNYRYNTQTDTWDTMAYMPTPLALNDGIAIDGKIYIPGGDSGPSLDSTTYVYDIASNSWFTITANGGYTATMSYQVVAIGTDLYVLGGRDSTDTTVSNVWILDTTTGAWSPGAPMQKAREAFSAAAIGGNIYVAGGDDYAGGDFTPDMTAEMFDGASWSYIAGVPSGGGAYTRWSYNADGHGADGLWLAGGLRDAGWNVLDHAGFYDPDTDTWTDSPTIPILSQGRVYVEGDVAADGYFYVIGGRDATGNVFYDTNERLLVGVPTYTLTVNSVGNGSVTLSPPGGVYTKGTVVTLTATPDIGWNFVGWSGDLTGTTNPATITMDSDKVVTATFDLITVEYTLTVATDGTGIGAVTKEPNQATYAADTVVTLTATADPGSMFAGWSGNLTGTTSPATITMDSDKVVTATFDLITVEYTLTVATDGTGSGAVTKEPNQATYAAGTVVTLTATADPGSTFAGWSGNLTGTTSPATITMDSHKVVTATFNLLPDVPWLSTDPISGIVPAGGAQAVDVVLDATGLAAGDYTAYLTINNNDPDENPATVTVTMHVVTGAVLSYTLTVNSVGNGSMMLLPPGGIYAEGTVVTLTATPDVGWNFVGWSGNLTGSANPTTIVMDSDKVVTATFQEAGPPPDISMLWQSFTFPPDGRSMVLDFWLHTEDTTDFNDDFYVFVYNEDFSQMLWGMPSFPDPGDWVSKHYKIPAKPAWVGRVLNLVFVVFSDGNSPHSAFWVDDISLAVCPESLSAANEYVRTDVHGSDGQFVVRTTGGEPSTTNDDDKNLLYGFYPDYYNLPWTSVTTLYVFSGTETLEYELRDFLPIQAPTLYSDTLVTRWRIEGIEVTQTLKLAENPYSGRDDTVLIAYDVFNWNTDEKQVGLRALLDVKIGDNDGAPYFVPGYGNLIHETEFISVEVPSYWKAFESPDFDPTFLKGQGILRGGLATPPDRFVITRWSYLYGSRWDYAITPGEVVTRDSAVALYWNPVSLYHGQGTYFATYYGLAGGGGATWLEAPAEVTCNELGFDVVLWVYNASSSPLEGGSSTLSLPSSLRLGHGETRTKVRPPIPPGEAQSVSWLVAASGDLTETLTINASTSFSNADPLAPAPLSILVPGCEWPLEPPTNLSADPGTQSIELSWDPSTSPGLEGYNIYRSSPGAGFTRITTTPVQATFYEDKDSSLVTETLYSYYVTSVDASRESEPSNIAQAEFGGLMLFIPQFYGPSGKIITVPINIANATGLGIYDQEVWLTYPADKLRVVDVKQTILTLDYAFAAVTQTVGTVGRLRIDILGGAVKRPLLYGEGSLYHVLFEVLGTEGLTGTMEFDQGQTEIYSNDNAFTPLSLRTENGAFEVRPNYMLGDLNGDKRVNSADAAIAIRIAVGKIIPNEYQRAAGDVNGDRRINSADAAIIMRVAVGLATLPGPSSRLTALRAPAGSPVNVSIGTASGNPGDTFWVPVNVDDATGIAGSNLMLNYDLNRLTPLDVQLGDLTAGKEFELDTNLDTPGIVRVSLSQRQTEKQEHQGLAGGTGALVKVQFRIEGEAQAGVTPLTLAKAKLNDTYSRDFATSVLQKSIEASDGQVTIGGERGPNKVYLPLVLRNL